VNARQCVRTGVLLWATLIGPIRAQQATTPPATGQSVIVQPARTGLASAPQELVEALDESRLPSTIPELLTELSKRADAIRQTIATGAYAQVWVPAMATKTVALVLERKAPSISEAARAKATVAIKEIVTGAWELDTHGDLGNKEKLDAAYGRLSAGVVSLTSAYGQR
jgi:hypothetical protein